MPNDPVLARSEMGKLLRSTRTSYDDDWFVRAGSIRTPEDIIAALTEYLTPERLQRFAAVLAGRTRNVSVVIEGMVDTGNVAAVMRTADGMGVQEIHTIDTVTKYKHSRRTSQGAEKWLDRMRWRSVDECVDFVRKSGQQLVVAHLSDDAVPIDDLDMTIPTAVAFGNELYGVSDEMLAAADAVAAIPIDGMIQSYNISVAAGIALYRIRQQRVAAGAHADMAEDDKRRLEAIWMIKTVPNVDPILEHVFTQR